MVETITMKCILTLIACSALMPLGRALDRPDQDLPYPSNVTGNATQACIGQFSDDVIADGAILCGGDVFLLYAPERFSAYSKVSGPFTSMTKVSLSSCPGRDALLASSSTGLVLLQWNAGTRGFASTTVLTDSSWANASQLQSLDFADGSTTKICAVSSNGTKILHADWDGAAISNASSLTVSSTILSLAALNWSGTGGAPNLDFAYDDGSKLIVVSSAGAGLFTYTNAYAQPIVTRMPCPSATDNVIWVTQNPFGSGQALTVVHSSNGSVEPPIFFGSMTAASLTLADIDADGLQDLVITRSGDHYAQVLYRQTSGSMSYGLFDKNGNQAPTLNLGNVYGSCTSAPAVAAGDLDGDGDEDVLFAGHAACGNEAFVWFANGVDEEFSDLYHDSLHIKPWILDMAEFIDGWDDGSCAQLSFSLWSSPTNAPANAATDLRVTVWGRQSGDGSIEPQCLVDSFVPASNSWCSVNIPPSYVGEAPQYLVVCFNYVERASGTVVHSYPSWVGQIDRQRPPGSGPAAGGTTTGGVDRPPPPPSSPPPSP
jgi:hypothetical protein